MMNNKLRAITRIISE